MRNHVLDLALFSPPPPTFHSPALPCTPHWVWAKLEGWFCVCVRRLQIWGALAGIQISFFDVAFSPDRTENAGSGICWSGAELMEEGWLHVYDPWGKRWLLFPCSMVCVKSKTDDIYQWLDSWNQASKVRYEKTRRKHGGEERGRFWRSAEISHLLLQSSCLADEWFFLEFRTPEHLKAMSRLTSVVIPCGIVLLLKGLISTYWSV